MPDASWGYTAQQGLDAVLGGKDVDKINKHEGAMCPQEMREYIMQAPARKNVSYEDESRRFAKGVLAETDKNPEEFLKDSKKFADKVCDSGDYDLTGFMFGWAVNAVRYVLGEKPIRNPAIVVMRRQCSS